MSVCNLGDADQKACLTQCTRQKVPSESTDPWLVLGTSSTLIRHFPRKARSSSLAPLTVFFHDLQTACHWYTILAPSAPERTYQSRISNPNPYQAQHHRAKFRQRANILGMP